MTNAYTVRSPGSRPPGWTLIELLLAIAIGALVITLLFSAYHTLMTALERRAGSGSTAAEAAAVLDAIVDDLSRIVPPDQDEDCGLRLSRDKTRDMVENLALCAAQPGDEQIDPRWFDVTVIEYRLEQRAIGHTLLRLARPDVGPGSEDPPVTNVLHHQVAHLDIRLFHEGEWVDAWDSEDEDALPRAARIEIALENAAGQAETLATEVFLPVGAVIEPTLQRQSIIAE